MLSSYAAYLIEHQFPAAVRENLRLLEALEGGTTRASGPELERLVAKALASRLEELTGTVAPESGRGEARAHPDPALLESSLDALAALLAQEGTLTAFLDPFTRDGATAWALAQAIKAHFAPLQSQAFRLVNAACGTAATLAARLEAEQEAARAQARAHEAFNRALLLEVARKRAIVSAAIDAVVTIDSDNIIHEFNPAAERIFGYTRDEVLGQDLLPLMVPERFREAHNRGIKHFMATGEGPALSKRVELPAMRRDGSEFPAEFVIIHLALEGQTVFTSFIRDLTDHKKSLEAAHQLEAMKRTDVLKDQFLSILSHELRTPINAIMGFGSFLTEEAEELRPDHRSYIERMLASADKLLSLVDDLLDLSRIQAGKFRLNPGTVNLPACIREAVTMLAPLAEQRHQHLDWQAAPDLPEIPGDMQRVGQVLTNYLNNAIKVTPEGGRISVSCEQRGQSVYCEVRDTGEGIAAEDLPKLFLRFGQLDTGNTRKSKGAGLGLSISKALIEAHGGEVGVFSKPGHGASFWFTLPVAHLGCPADT